MLHRLSALSSFVLVACLATGASLAQYAGPSSTPTYRTVDDVLKNPVDDAPVLLEGYVIRQVSKEKYMFSDGKSEIRVEIDSKDFPTTPIDEKTRVQIRGEVEKDFLESPEIDVDSVTILK